MPGKHVTCFFYALSLSPHENAWHYPHSRCYAERSEIIQSPAGRWKSCICDLSILFFLSPFSLGFPMLFGVRLDMS